MVTMHRALFLAYESFKITSLINQNPLPCTSTTLGSKWVEGSYAQLHQHSVAALSFAAPLRPLDLH